MLIVVISVLMRVKIDNFYKHTRMLTDFYTLIMLLLLEECVINFKVHNVIMIYALSALA